ncbi:hypothetical protein OQA88_11570 [Cercophora sp. LCS_1]
MRLTTVLTSLLAPAIALGNNGWPAGSELAGEEELAAIPSPGITPGEPKLKRRDACSPVQICARRLKGTKSWPGMPPLTDRAADCSSFMVATVTVTVIDSTSTTVETTTTTTSTTTTGETTTVDTAVTTTTTELSSAFSTTTVLPTFGLDRRLAPARVPEYLTEWCDPSQYSRACSRWGITSTVTVPGLPAVETSSVTEITTQTDTLTESVTATSTETTTETTTSTSVETATATSLTCVLEARNAATNASLGYIQVSNLHFATFTTDINVAQALTFDLVEGVTVVKQVNIVTSDPRGAYWGAVVGRDNTNSIIAPGSFHYLYLGTPMPGSTPPGSTPQMVPNYYTTASGASKEAESAVWAIDLATGSVWLEWINPDGATVLPELFTQSAHLYGGGSAAAFNARFPSTVTPLTLWWVTI